MAFTILVIDDEPPIRAGISAIIKKEIPGVTVLDEASNGEEGFALYTAHDPDLIISDIVMPKLDGLELLTKIRATGSRTPMILVSGYDEFAYARKAIELGATNYLLKPVNRSELIASIMTTIERHSATTQPFFVADIKALQESAQTLFLQRLISGQLETAEEVATMQRSIGITIEESDLTVMSFASRALESQQELQQLLSTLSSQHIIATVPYQHHQVLLIRGNEQQAERIAQSFLQDADGPVAEQLIVGIGTHVTSLLNAAHSFQQALAALSYYPYYQQSKQIFTQEVIDDTAPSIHTGDIDTAALKALLLMGTDQEVETWVGEFFSLLLYIKTPPLSFIKGMCIFVLSDIQKQLSEVHHVAPKHFGSTQSIFSDHINTVQSMQQQLLENLLQVKNEVIPQSQLENDAIIHFAKTHVQQNLHTIVSAEEIAERMDVTASYFSTYFRTHTGETFRSYVNRTKDTYAKQLLANFDLSIEEIALALGYTDYRSFHRVFKKANDLTPSSYRKKLRSSGDRE